MTRRVVVFLTVMILSSVSAFAQGDAKAVDAGKKLFADLKCTTCHMIGGKGGTMTKQFPLDGVAVKLSAADIRKWLTSTAEMEAKLEKKPVMKMSSKKFEFKDGDIDALVAYLTTLKAK